MKWIQLLIIGSVLSACDEKSPKVESKLIGRDEAVSIAIRAMQKTYSSVSTSLEEWDAEQAGYIWIIHPRLPKRSVGGGASAIVDRKTEEGNPRIFHGVN